MFVYKFLCGHVFISFGYTYLKAQCWVHMVREHFLLFPKWRCSPLHNRLKWETSRGWGVLASPLGLVDSWGPPNMCWSACLSIHHQHHLMIRVEGWRKSAPCRSPGQGAAQHSGPSTCRVNFWLLGPEYRSDLLGSGPKTCRSWAPPLPLPGLPYSSLFLPWQGASANWWNHRHFQHHAKPNIFHKDPDVNMLHVFVLGEWQPIEVRWRGQGSHGVFGLHRNREGPKGGE